MPDILIRGYKAKEQIEDIIKQARYAANNCMIGSGLEIIELPEHGDLIDRNETLKAMEWTWAGKAAFEAVENVRTIVPAEREDSE